LGQGQFILQSRLASSNLPWITGWGWREYLVACYGSAAMLLPGGGEFLFAFTALIGLFHLSLPSLRSALATQLQQSRKLDFVLLSLAFASIFLVKALSLLWSIKPAVSFRDLSTHVHFIAFPLVAAVLLGCRHLMTALSVGAQATGIVGGLWATAYIFKNANNPEPFIFEAGGQNPLVLALFVAILIVWLFIELTRQFSWLRLAAIVGSISMLVATGRRTPIVALAAVILVGCVTYAYQTYRNKRAGIRGQRVRHWRRYVGALGLALSCAAALAANRWTEWQLAISEFQRFFAQGKVDTSIGTRLELYQVALRAIELQPWLGYGAGTTRELVARHSEKLAHLHSSTHFHNQYLQWLTESGVIGTALITIGLVWIWRSVVSGPARKGSKVWPYAASMMVVYAVSALSGSILKQGLVNSFFVFFAAALWIAAQSTALENDRKKLAS
jgi:O-antigen ligase